MSTVLNTNNTGQKYVINNSQTGVFGIPYVHVGILSISLPIAHVACSFALPVR